MPQFTLDYSPPQSRNRLRRRKSTLSSAALLGFCLLVNGLVLVGICLLARENRQLRRERDAHVLRYDSLLATKLHADRLLAEKRKALAPVNARSPERPANSN